MKIGPRPKLAVLLVLSTLALVYSEPVKMLYLLTATIVIALIFGARLASFLHKIRKFLYVLIMLTVIQIVFVRSGEPILQIKSFTIVTEDGLFRGITAGVRYFVIICSASIMASEESSRVICSLTQMKIPYVFAFMLITALRFIPLFSEEFSDALTAIQLRGAELKKVPFGKKIKLYTYLLTPVTAGAIIKSKNLAAAMDARGFRANKLRTSLLVLKMTALDWLVLALAVVGLAAGICIEVFI